MTRITTTTPISELLALPVFMQCDKALATVRQSLADGFSTEAARKECNERLGKPGAVLDFVPGNWVNSQDELVSWASLSDYDRARTMRMTISGIEQEARSLRAWVESFALVVDAYHGKALRKVRV